MIKQNSTRVHTIEEFPPVTAGEDEIITRHRNEHLRMVALHSGVAAHMGNGWKFEMERTDTSWWGPTYRYRIVTGRGYSFDLAYRSGAAFRGKVHVSGNWPRNTTPGAAYMSPRDVGMESPSINCAEERGHEAIARDIQRRFLPNYLKIYDALVAKIATDNAYQDRRMMSWKRLTDAKLVVDPRERNSELVGNVHISKGYGDIRLTGDDSVEIHLRSLPIETAMRVLEVLKGGGVK